MKFSDMRPEDASNLIVDWVNWCDRALFEVVPLMGPILKSELFQPEHMQVLRELSSACLRSTKSSLILAEAENLWDADILMRGVCEGSLKFVFLLSSKEDFPVRFNEFSNILFDLSLLKQHRKAKAALEVLPSTDEKIWDALRGVILTEEEFDKLSKKYSKEERQCVEKKWGFTNLISQIANSGISGMDRAVSLLHGYSMASHVHHMDVLGNGIFLEREYRPAPERLSVHLAHAARLISDIYWYTVFRIQAGNQFTSVSSNALNELVKRHEVFFEDMKKVSHAWAEQEYG